MNLVGFKDALALTGLGVGLLASTPLLSGSTLALAALSGPIASGLYFGKKAARILRSNQLSEDVRENFIIPSDQPPPPCLATAGGLRIGYTTDFYQPVDIAYDFLMRHTAIVGSSGVGKTVLGTYMLWTQMCAGGGWIFIDGKNDGDTRDQLALMAKLIGREEDFYVINIDEPEHSHTYNPILNGDGDEVSSCLLNLTPSTEGNAGSDHYKQSAGFALTTIINALKSADKLYHFGDLAVMFQSGKAVESLKAMPIKDPLVANKLEIFLDQYAKKTKDGVEIDTEKMKNTLGGMGMRIAGFAQGKFGKVFNTYAPEVDLTDIILGNKFLYVMLPTMSKDNSALQLGKMIMSDLRIAVYNVQKLKKIHRPNPPFLVFADEMGSYVTPGVSRLFEQARSSQVALLPAFQSFSQLNQVSPDFADMIIQNTWNKIFFKFGSNDSTETAADIIGKTKRFAYSVSKSENSGDSAQSLRITPQQSESESEAMGESWREAEEYRVGPEKLKALGMGECVVVSGPRMFHVKTPFLKFPKAPEYKVIRHKTRVPYDKFPLELEDRFRMFLTVGAPPKKKEEKEQAPSETNAEA